MLICTTVKATTLRSQEALKRNIVKELLEKISKVKWIRKGTVLFRQGELAKNFYFVKEGLVKAYYSTPDGKQFIKTFVQEGGFIASMQAIVSDQPSSFTAICLEDCQILETTGSKLLHAVSIDTEYLRMLNTLLLKLASKKERREFELLCLPPEKRYRLLCEQEPELVKRLSLEDVARYLGITPVSLSRIRKRGRPGTDSAQPPKAT